MAESPTHSPIFIVGANRSGTTLLRLLLNAHPRIAIPDELVYLDSLLAGVPIEAWDQPGLSTGEYEAFVDDVLHKQCAPLDELDRDQLKKEILADPPNFRRPYQCALEAWARHHGKERWGEKTPGNLFYADILLDMFPEAQFLYVVRDPRAGVASMQEVSFFPGDVVFNTLSRRKHDVDGRALLEQNVPASQRRTVQYEALVRDPESTMREVCIFLDEAFEPQMLRFHEDAGQFMRKDARRHHNAAATRPITDDRIDAWKEQLTADQVATVEHICADVMQDFGYAPTGQRPSLAAWGEIAVKQAYWTWQCWRHRHVRHYTVKHPIFARTRSRLRALLR